MDKVIYITLYIAKTISMTLIIIINEYVREYYIFPSLDVYEGPRSDSNNNDNGRRDQTCVNKCIR